MFKYLPNIIKNKLPPFLHGGKKKLVVPFIRMEGTIQAGASGGPGGNTRINLNRFNPLLEKAFKSKAPAVVLVINSPGGSPVQSSLIYKQLVNLKHKHNKKLHIFVEDVCASGGMYIAAAGDDIIVDESSIVGSVGVISQTFGAKELIDKVGLEPRLLTAGRVKSQNNMFEDVKVEDQKRTQTIISNLHTNFIDIVKEGRKDKLNFDLAMQFAKEANDEIDVSKGDGLFDGSYYEGNRAVMVGFADEIAQSSMENWLQEKYGGTEKGDDDQEINVVAKQIKSPGFPSFLPFSSNMMINMDGVADQVADSLCEKVKDDMIWSKYKIMA